MACPWRASSSKSARRSRAAAKLRFWWAASWVIVFSFWAMVVRRSCVNFSSRVIGGFLSVFQDEGIVVEQGQRVGGELIQFRVAQLQGGLRLTGRGDLVQEMGHVIGAKSAGGESLLEGFGDLLGPISTK